jgi:DNA-binding transcriptional regulator YhcF (GntR family)
MILTLNLSSDQPLFLQIADAVKRALVAGDLGPGDALPPGRELAASLDVSLETVQRAYRQLVDESIVTSRVGRGTRVADPLDLDRLGVDNIVRELVQRAKHVGVSKGRLLELIDDAY